MRYKQISHHSRGPDEQEKEKIKEIRYLSDQRRTEQEQALEILEILLHSFKLLPLKLAERGEKNQSDQQDRENPAYLQDPKSVQRKKKKGN